ncbi:Uncharacterised protein [Yersinia enterocolitica]|uniref:Uncharacterized protein n=1 Tax=Proteus terrae subsp. cibarius TaxID=626774 RepID=A0ABX6JV42_9GAMM|nr:MULTISPECIES: hypothetical protein [Enterobacterales]MBU5964351.1 hypothetical protein [Proteus mirabilis]QGW05305.1 hypothetical protein F9282_20120 [Proteus terrae subsp. cibarius]QHD96420.1 hypothetical protein GSM99_18645 [Proteus terrae subsp. cibarius]QIF92339.1 hypothetical protein GTH23_20060 [Proteus terrae subsp. cibarius]QJW53090.1 hypothetical protein HND96_19555 [Proteus terrae subsp. cibarius]
MKKNPSSILISLIDDGKIIGYFHSTNVDLNRMLSVLIKNTNQVISNFINGYQSYEIQPDNSRIQHLMVYYIKAKKNCELYIIDQFYKELADFWDLYENNDLESIILSIPE